jgi:hypothetical protein
MRVIGGAQHLGPQGDDAGRGDVGHGDAGEQFVARMGAVQEGQRLGAVQRPRPRQDGPQHARDQAGQKHARRDLVRVAIAIGVKARQVDGVIVARGRGEGQQIVHGDKAAEFGAVAEAQFVEGLVFKFHGLSPACVVTRYHQHWVPRELCGAARAGSSAVGPGGGPNCPGHGKGQPPCGEPA